MSVQVGKMFAFVDEVHFKSGVEVALQQKTMKNMMS